MKIKMNEFCVFLLAECNKKKTLQQKQNEKRYLRATGRRSMFYCVFYGVRCASFEPSNANCKFDRDVCMIHSIIFAVLRRIIAAHRLSIGLRLP